MCNYSDFVWNNGMKEGKKEGIKQGKAEDLVNMMESLKMSIEQAMQALKIPENDWDEYRALVAQLEAQPAS